MSNGLQVSRLFRNRRKGEAIVEFALLAPMLIFILFALVDFGRVFDAWVVSTNAAREGARYASSYAAQDYMTTAQVQQLGKQKTFDYLDGGLNGRSDVSYALSDITVSVPSKAPGQPVTVTVSIKVQIWTLLNIFGSSQATIEGQATMRI